MAWALAILGAALIAVSFYVQVRVNARNAGLEFAGIRTTGTVTPWAIGLVGGICVLIALIIWIMSLQPNRPVVLMGWHDDPRDATMLRYHDGAAWTDRTARKA